MATTPSGLRLTVLEADNQNDDRLTYAYKGNFRATEPFAEKFFRFAVESVDPARG